MTKKKVNELLKKYNATLEITREGIDYMLYEVIAPDGFQWVSGNCQILNIRRYLQFLHPMFEIYTEMIERMESGLEPYVEN